MSKHTKNFGLIAIALAVPFVLLLVVSKLNFYFGVIQRGESIEITQLSQPQTLRIQTPQEEAPILALKIFVKGVVDGSANIRIFDGNILKRAFVIQPGKVHMEISMQWETPAFTLKYEPENVQRGELEIKYRFVKNRYFP